MTMLPDLSYVASQAQHKLTLALVSTSHILPHLYLTLDCIQPSSINSMLYESLNPLSNNCYL